MICRSLLFAVCIAIATMPTLAHAVVITNYTSSGPAAGADNTFNANASAIDLVNTGQLTFSGVTTTRNPTFGFGGLNNGVAGTDTTNSAFYRNTELSSSVTFTLNTGVNTNGYDVQSIRTLAGWTGVNITQANQQYEVLYSRVGSPIYQSLGTFTNAPFSASSNSGSSTQTLLTDSTGLLAGNVDAVRFNLIYPGIVGNGSTLGTVYRELDVHGVASTAAAPAYVNLITNGSFEATALAPLANQSFNSSGAAAFIPGWSLNGEATLVRGTFGTIASDGPQWLSLESNGLSTVPNNDGTISQTIATTAGNVYQLDFDYNALGFDGAGTWSMSYDLGEGPVNLTIPDGANLTLGAWLHVTDQFIATGPTTTFSFTGNAQVNGFFGPAVDNVGVSLIQAQAVPEPASWATWLVAAGGIACAIFWARRRVQRV